MVWSILYEPPRPLPDHLQARMDSCTQGVLYVSMGTLGILTQSELQSPYRPGPCPGCLSVCCGSWALQICQVGFFVGTVRCGAPSALARLRTMATDGLGCGQSPASICEPGMHMISSHCRRASAMLSAAASRARSAHARMAR